VASAVRYRQNAGPSPFAAASNSTAALIFCASPAFGVLRAGTARGPVAD